MIEAIAIVGVVAYLLLILAACRGASLSDEGDRRALAHARARTAMGQAMSPQEVARTLYPHSTFPDQTKRPPRRSNTSGGLTGR